MSFRETYRTNWRRPGQGSRQRCAVHYHRSGHEAKVCGELARRQENGEISNFIVERPLRLYLNNTYMGSYVVDFVVHYPDGVVEYIEAKGIPFGPWKQKWALLQNMHKDNAMVKFLVVK